MNESEQLAAHLKQLDDTWKSLMALVARSFQLRPNPDGTLDTDYENGDKPPEAATLAWGDYSAVSALIANQNTGTVTSHDVRQYLSGTGAASATISIVTSSGDDAAAEGWTIENGDDLSHPGTGAGSGSFRIRATITGNSVDTNPINWAYAAAPAGDTTAPTIPSLSYTAQEGQVTAIIGASTDPYDGEAASGVKEYDLEIDGNVTVKAASPGLSLELTQTIVGDSEGTPSSTQSGANWQLVFGGAGFDSTADHYLFRGAQITGDFTAVVKVVSITSAADFAKGGIGVFESLTPGAKRVLGYLQKNNKAQGRNRVTDNAGDGGNQFNDAVNVGAYVRIKRTGGIFTIATSTDRNTWTDRGTPNNPMASTVYVGMIATSTSVGTPASIEFEEFSLNNAPDVSHVITTSAPVDLRVRARDIDLNVSSYGSLITATPLPASQAGGVEFDPGHILMADNGASLAGRLSYVDEIANLDHIKGLHVRYYWEDLETTQGNYVFNQPSGNSDLEQLYNACAAAGKKLTLEVWKRNFGGTSTSQPNSVIPAYVVSLGGTNNLIWSGSGWVCTVWRSHVMDRLIALYDALAARFGSLEFWGTISTGETSVANPSALSGTDYTPAAFVSQTKRLLTAMREAWPTKQIRCGANFISNGTNAQMVDLFDHMRLHQIAVGGPDIFSTNDLNYKTQGQRVLIGEIAGNYDYLADMFVHFHAEQPTFVAPTNMTNILDKANNVYHCHHVSWQRATWTSPTDWVNDIKPALAANPNLNNTQPAFGDWDAS